MENSKIDILVDELKEYLNPDFYTKGVSAIERLIAAVRGEKSHQTIYFVCDKKSCGEECKNPDCHHTSDIHHAKNFHEDVDGVYVERCEEK